MLKKTSHSKNIENGLKKKKKNVKHLFILFPYFKRETCNVLFVQIYSYMYLIPMRYNGINLKLKGLKSKSSSNGIKYKP